MSSLFYISYGSVVSLSGNMVHAGGFTFGCNKGNEYTNQCKQFCVCNGSRPDSKTIQDAMNGMN